MGPLAVRSETGHSRIEPGRIHGDEAMNSSVRQNILKENALFLGLFGAVSFFMLDVRGIWFSSGPKPLFSGASHLPEWGFSKRMVSQWSSTSGSGVRASPKIPTELGTLRQPLCTHSLPCVISPCGG